MKITRFTRCFLFMSLLTVLTPIVLFAPQAYAETYVAGQLGMTFPQSLSNGKVTQEPVGGLDLSEQPLKNSFMLGGKLGHYFTQARWIGIETGVILRESSRERGSADIFGPRRHPF